MRCESIMKQKVECASPRDTAENAARRMRDDNIGFLPVCDGSGKVLGTLTDRDIAIRLVATGKQPGTEVDAIMTRQIVACRPQDDIQEAQRLMVQHHKSRIMCLDDGGRLAGIISLSDIAQTQGAGPISELLRGITEREASL